jgi:hypothetical protein
MAPWWAGARATATPAVGMACAASMAELLCCELDALSPLLNVQWFGIPFHCLSMDHHDCQQPTFHSPFNGSSI